MFNNYKTLKINLKGGIVSPSWLLSVLEIAEKAGINNISFGGRQQLILKVHNRELTFFYKKMAELEVDIESDSDEFPNILSSYSTAEIFQNNTEGWLSEGVYQDVLDLFDYKPKLKINICDALQSYAPFFTGHLNFISSDVPHFWFCFIRFPKTHRIERFPNLIYTQDLALFAQRAEYELLEMENLDFLDMPHYLHFTEGLVMRTPENELIIPRFVMPYYEGVNLYGAKPWIGIYRRNEQFSMRFLKEMCVLCDKTKVGTLCITTWRSLIIKGVLPQDRFVWEKLLGKYGINVRHAALELNWHTEDDAPVGFKVKQYLVKEFDKMDVRTFGLLFAIKTRHKSEVFGSVIIRREPFFQLGKWSFDPFGWFGVFDIFYAEDFNPHSRKRKTHQLAVPKWRLALELMNLSKKYYAQLTNEKAASRVAIVQKPKKQVNEIQANVYQCGHCWSVYDPLFGEPTQGITEGVAFQELPKEYCCPICEASKEDFVLFRSSLFHQNH